MLEFPEIAAHRTAWERALARLAKASKWDASRTSFLQRQIASHAKDLRRLAKFKLAGDKHGAVRKQAQILRSFPARVCSTLDQLTHPHGSSEPLSPMSWEDFEHLVQSNPLTGERPDPCKVIAIKKQNGNKRIITSPGPKTRAAQKTLAVVLEARGIENPYDFNRKGKGGPAALLAIKRLMIDEGLRWFVVFDLAEFFSSVRPKHLKGLMLPNEVQQNVVFYNRYAMLIQRYNGITRWSIGGKCNPARRGIPQGATASGKIASALLGRELRHLSGDQGIVTYVDDGVIGVRTQPEAKEVAIALEKRFANLNGGPIHFKHISVSDAHRGFAFLGYWVQFVEVEGEPQVRFTPSRPAKKRFRQKLHRRLRKKGPSLSWDEALEELANYRSNWIAQKPLWQPSEFKMEEFEIETECWVDDFFNGYTNKIPILGSKLGAKK